MNKFLLGKAPFIRRADESLSTNRMMIDLLIAMAPLIIFGWVKNGLLPFIQVDGVSVLTMLYPLIVVIAGAFLSFFFESVYFYFFKKVRDFKELMSTVWNSYAIIPGIMLALILPVNVPILYLVFGCLLANVVFKMLFGGFGHNIFNPALIAYVIIVATFTKALGSSSMYLSPAEVTSSTISAVSGATPLSNSALAAGTISYDALVAPYGGILNFFLGFVPGGMGVTSVALMILGYIYLSVRKVIDWKMPLVYLGVVAVIVSIITLVNSYGGWYIGYQMLTGSLWFGAIFMATEPVTSPKNPDAKLFFAAGCGVLTCLFRFVGSFPEGVATAILFMGLLAPVLDSTCAVARANSYKNKTWISYVVIGVLLAGIAAYTIIKMA